MPAIDYANLSTDVASLDQALYVASCMAGAWGGSAHIYSTTDPAHATVVTGERYLILSNDAIYERLATDDEWLRVFSPLYTLTRAPSDD